MQAIKPAFTDVRRVLPAACPSRMIGCARNPALDETVETKPIAQLGNSVFLNIPYVLASSMPLLNLENKMKKLFVAVATFAAFFTTQLAFAEDGRLIDSVSTDFAAGTATQMVRIGVQSDWNKRWFESNGTHLSGYWDLSFGDWHGTRYKGVKGDNQNLTDIGLDPTFRFENDDKKGLYYEGAIGVHRLSKFYNNDGHRLSTLFEFGDHVGVGYVFRNHWEIGARIEHFSNGGYSEPNSGVNFFDVRASYHF